ncbi:MAG: c-type cytochrome [Acidobacteriaceae bacterium]
MLLCVGCKDVPGRPGAVAKRPDQVANFNVLYQQNCAACHGKDGRHGDAISLANPVYLAFAGSSEIQKVTADGVTGTLMPAFAKSQGGMLTDQQIQILAQGAEAEWGAGNVLSGQTVPSYSSTASGDVAHGQQAFATFCARCHGADGSGVAGGQLPTGSLIDPAYLALISDQGLRSIIVAGQPDDGMPDWRSDIQGASSRAMTDQEIADVVAWLASHRIAAPGQPYGHP